MTYTQALSIGCSPAVPTDSILHKYFQKSKCLQKETFALSQKSTRRTTSESWTTNYNTYRDNAKIEFMKELALQDAYLTSTSYPLESKIFIILIAL